MRGLETISLLSSIIQPYIGYKFLLELWLTKRVKFPNENNCRSQLCK